jgi:hypothetical protein
MLQITYETGQASVQTGAVQYNVQPNLSASRAIQALEKGILGAMQLGGQIRADIKEENYQVAVLDQKKRHETFQTEIASMSYPQRKEAIGKFNEANASLYDETTKFGRVLSANEATFQGGVLQNLRTEGVEYEYLDNQTSQNNAFLEAKEKWLTATPEEKTQIVADLEATQVTPLLTFDDKYSKKLLGSAQASLSDFKITMDKEAIAVTNNSLWGGALEAAVSQINKTDTLDEETRNRILTDKLGRISTYGEKGNELRQKFDEVVLTAILSKGKEAMGDKPSYEQTQTLLKNLTDYAKISPKVKGSDTYTKTLNAANVYINAVNKRDLGSLNSLIINDGASKKEVVSLGEALLARGVLSQQDYDAKLFLKDTKMVEKNVTPGIVAAYRDGNMSGLGEFMKNGRGAAVARVVTDNLQVELGSLLNTQGLDPVEAFGQVMQKIQTFANQGIYVNKIEAIDNVLKMPAKGGIKSLEDVQLFIGAMNQAHKYNYDPNLRKENMADYLVLQSWIKTGIPDIVSNFQSYKINPKRVTDEEVLKQYNYIVDNDEFFAKDLTDANNRRYKAALLPGIKALLRAGIEPDTVVDQFEKGVETHYIGVNMGWGTNNRVLMPIVGHLKSDTVYETILNQFPDRSVLPMNLFEPTGNWMVLDDKTGKTEIYPFAAIEYLGKFGKLPSSAPKQ